jgi:hypothetical protein
VGDGWTTATAGRSFGVGGCNQTFRVCVFVWFAFEREAKNHISSDFFLFHDQAKIYILVMWSVCESTMFSPID